MIEFILEFILIFIPDIFGILLTLSIAAFAYYFSTKSGKQGLVLIALGFSILAVPYIVDLALGGPYFTLRLDEQGYSIYQIGMINFYRFIWESALQIAFAVLVVLGLFEMSQKNQS